MDLLLGEKGLDFLGDMLTQARARVVDPKCFNFLLHDLMAQLSSSLRKNKLDDDNPLIAILRYDYLAYSLPYLLFLSIFTD